VSQPSDVAASNSRYRCHSAANDRPGVYAMEPLGSSANGQNDRFSVKPKK
jgi:hypothetical protein